MDIRHGRADGAEPPAGTIISSALRLCREHWRPLAVYGLVAGLPVSVLDAVIALERGIDPFASPLSGDAAAGDGGSLVSSLLSLVLYALASAACVHTVAAAREGHRSGWREGLAAGLGRLGGVLVASVIVLVLVVLGLLALVLPGIWIAVALSLATPALVLERLTPVAAIRRSFTLVQRRWWKTAAVVLMAALVAFAALAVVAVPTGLAAAATPDRSLRAVIAAVAGALSTALVVPITVAVVTVLFLERRGAVSAEENADDGGRFRGFAPPVPPSSVDRPAPAEDSGFFPPHGSAPAGEPRRPDEPPATAR